MKIGSYEFMEGSYESLNYYANEMLTYVNTIKSIVKNLDNNGHWDGNGFNEYNNKLNDLAVNFSSFMDEVFELNKMIKKTIEKYQAVDKAVAGV